MTKAAAADAAGRRCRRRRGGGGGRTKSPPRPLSAATAPAAAAAESPGEEPTSTSAKKIRTTAAAAATKQRRPKSPPPSSPEKPAASRRQQQRQQRGRTNGQRKSRRNDYDDKKPRKRRQPQQRAAQRNDDDVVAQLRRQRLKQQQRQRQQHREEEKEAQKEVDRHRKRTSAGGGPDAAAAANDEDGNGNGNKKQKAQKRRMGSYEYCSERDAYYPAGYLRQRQRQRQQQQRSSSEEDRSASAAAASAARRFRTPPYAAVIEDRSSSRRRRRRSDYQYETSVCSDPTQRRALAGRWRGRALLDGGVNTPSYRPRVGGDDDESGGAAGAFVDLPFPPGYLQFLRMVKAPAASFWIATNKYLLERTPLAEPDVARKMNLPTWSRTFDVMWDAHSTYVTTVVSDSRSILSRTVVGEEFPTCHQYNCFTPADMGLSVSCVRTSAFVCDDDVLSRKDFIYGMIETNEFKSAVTLHLVGEELDGGRTVSLLPVPANDFVVASDASKIVVAAPPERLQGPYLADISPNSGVNMAQQVFVGRFPRSDPICVEPQHGDPYTYCFGHMNGQISCYDLRGNDCSTTPVDTDFGNVTRLNILPSDERPHQLLARGSGGYCRLYDVRNVSSSVGTTSVLSQRASSIVHEFRLPDAHPCDVVNTSRCNGVAADREATVVISPFVDGHSLPRLGIWSMFSGEFIGSKVLDDGRNNNRYDGSTVSATTNATRTSYTTIELCGETTPGFKWDPYEDVVQPEPGSFGLWYKLARASEGADSLPPDAGNIHHVAFDAHG